MKYVLTKEGMADRTQQALWITESVACEACGEGFAAKYQTTKAHYSDDSFTILRCRRCGLIFASPRLEKTFRDFCYQREKHLVDWFERGRVEAEREARRTLDVLDVLGVAGGDILDVGCGIGVFLSVARERGFRCTGVEFNEKCATSAARYGRIVQGDFYDLDLPPSGFDAVHMSQVVEHLGQPLAALRKACHLLRRGGLLWVAVPGTDWVRLLIERLPKVGRGRTPFWSPEDHLYYFAPRAMRRLFELAGFASEALPYKPSGGKKALRRFCEVLGMSPGVFVGRKPIKSI